MEKFRAQIRYAENGIYDVSDILIDASEIHIENLNIFIQENGEGISDVARIFFCNELTKYVSEREKGAKFSLSGIVSQMVTSVNNLESSPVKVNKGNLKSHIPHLATTLLRTPNMTRDELVDIHLNANDFYQIEIRSQKAA
jgi:hypothetical protein